MDKFEEEGSNSKQFIVYKNASSSSGGAFFDLQSVDLLLHKPN